MGEELQVWAKVTIPLVSAAVCGFLTVAPAGALESTGDSECRALLQRVTQLTGKLRENRGQALAETFRSLHDKCVNANIDVRIAAKAAVVVSQYGSEWNDEEDLELLTWIDSRLRYEEPCEERAAVLRAIGDKFAVLGRFEKAENSLLEALELRKQVRGPMSAEVVEDLQVLSFLQAQWARQSEPEKHRQRALEVAAEAISVTKARGGPRGLEMERMRLYMVSLLEELGIAGEAAEKVLRKYDWETEESSATKPESRAVLSPPR